MMCSICSYAICQPYTSFVFLNCVACFLIVSVFLVLFMVKWEANIKCCCHILKCNICLKENNLWNWVASWTNCYFFPRTSALLGEKYTDEKNWHVWLLFSQKLTKRTYNFKKWIFFPVMTFGYSSENSSDSQVKIKILQNFICHSWIENPLLKHFCWWHWQWS